MLTEKNAATTKTRPGAGPAPAGSRDVTDATRYFEGRFVPRTEAKVSIMTHAFMYGTAVFEGIRAYWNADQEQLYALKVREHVERIRASCRIMMMDNIPSVDELSRLIVETARRNNFHEDVYIRPSFYKSTLAIGVKLHGLQHQLYILSVPFGNYVDVDNGIRIGTVSWRRTSDNSIPSRAKIVGSYVNPAFSKTEAMLNGYDEALVLTESGHASEGSAENLFIVRDGVLITPAVVDDILEGITRAGIIEIAAEMGLEVVERSI